MNGWKTLTDMTVNAESIKRIEAYCSELLIHAADVEGLCQGIDEELVQRECGDERGRRRTLLVVWFCLMP
jgi:phosphoribosylformimino-5-aminoimidazole carboxamide ribonucleotide (ProFAR) isomerase